MYNAEEIIKQIGRNIKAERIRKGLSQEQLAEIFNCDRDHISKIECGTQNMSLKKIVKITNCLQVDIRDILRL
jgi:transcriptional regulator with XRE-family HTH domain